MSVRKVLWIRTADRRAMAHLCKPTSADCATTEPLRNYPIAKGLSRLPQNPTSLRMTANYLHANSTVVGQHVVGRRAE